MPLPRLSLYELSILPEALFFLALARWRVVNRPARRWLPVGDPGVQSDNDPESGDPPAAASDLSRTLAIARLVEGLGRRLPWKSVCLDQALAAHYMYNRRGIAHVLHFGVLKKRPDEMLAHAWISSGTRVVVGETKAIDYREVSRFHV